MHKRKKTSIRRGPDSDQQQKKEATHHADKQPGLLRGPPHAGVPNDADREARSQTCEADRQPRPELDEALGERHRDGHWEGERRG